jgi:ATP-dependent exoDNAse (exonuclease V) beta subunit
VLQLIAQKGWSEDREAAIRTQLSAMGVPRNELDSATERTMEVIRQTLTSDRGRWILQEHEEAVNEWEVSGVFGNHIYSRKLDRSFISEGVRWIVDYKTGGNHDQYRAQLEQYAELVSRLDHRPIKLGLYFPLTGAWHEWTPSTQTPATQTLLPPSP